MAIRRLTNVSARAAAGRPHSGPASGEAHSVIALRPVCESLNGKRQSRARPGLYELQASYAASVHRGACPLPALYQPSTSVRT